MVAPLFWIALGGLTGGALYKAVNTADSMIGHKTERFFAFGWATARLDDLVNLPASRLAALWLVAAAAVMPDVSAREAWLTVARDAGRHRSPNAGWPEAAMAGALGVRLAGPRSTAGPASTTLSWATAARRRRPPIFAGASRSTGARRRSRSPRSACWRSSRQLGISRQHKRRAGDV